nr:ATP-dependent DNA helicase PIF4-like [Solanum lycopersicum]
MNERCYTTFREAAEKRSLLRSDNNLIDCMSEAVSYQMPYSLRRLFATLLVYCNPGAFFIDGPGGTGKTFLYRALLAAVRTKGFIALATASSGVAASILPGGRTAHSRFKIPVDIDHNFTCNISKQSSLAILIRDSKLIVWDEVSMAKKT